MTSQLSPFNENQFDRCMLWFCVNKGKSLNQYDMVKLHVLTDIFHTLDYGLPVIGGTMRPWPYGPVVQDAYFRIMNVYSVKGPFKMSSGSGNTRQFSPSECAEIDPDDFSVSEVKAMERAWLVHKIEHPGFNDSQRYFHEPSASFIGKAYDAAQREGRNLSWEDIVTAYDEESGEDHSHVLSLMSLGI